MARRGRRGKGNTRHNAAVVARWLDRRQSKGWTWQELSDRSSIPLSTLQWWKCRLAEGQDQEPGAEGLTFVEASVVDDDAQRSPRPSRCAVEFRTGHRLVFEEPISMEAVRVLVHALSGE